ncbi:unnamed protein product [Bursaphelenchus xylophilus]|uniref:(pine wood nematode) hypothetical protein n=1 Tax=Bursaphelenchus xylophilus TaxID=6326 RepID=A0A1I7S372_BURXY|nr:unnamed protein product [Bursaphelenchus xylophilus]CAG9116118.1 unnamed protein product [Bursaphelenchus xylophilus]
MSPLLTTVTALFLFSSVYGQRQNAITDKVGQGNFAFARPFAFALTENGEWYPIAKRSRTSTFAFKETPKEKERDSFAFAKRSEDPKFAYDFAKRAKFAFLKK